MITRRFQRRKQKAAISIREKNPMSWAALRVLPALLAAALSSGCATIRGSQDALKELRPTSSAESISIALQNFASSDASKRFNLDRRDYRDIIIRDYTQRIEANYNAFVDQLQVGDRGGALGFDIVQLGLSAMTGFVKPKHVEELAALSTVTAGARASIDKRVFYDRTVSALIATMDTRRAEIKADIARKRRLPATEYSLNDAFDDLNLLADAGDINRAFSRLTRNAEAAKASAEARLDAIPAACEGIVADDAKLIADFRGFLNASTTNIAAAAKEMEVDTSADPDPKPELLDAIATNYCGAATKRALLQKLKVPGY